MKLLYDPDTDSLSIDLNAKPGADVLEIVDGLIIDVDEEGQPVGIDIQHASQHLDLSTLETQASPGKRSNCSEPLAPHRIREQHPATTHLRAFRSFRRRSWVSLAPSG
jgi:uncharacterized protein YuzE